jgi:hypothetical protein
MKMRSSFHLSNPSALILAATLLAGAALGAAAQDAAGKESRIALVIGNGSYSNVPLKNPANDARDLSDALKGLGFSVTLIVDGDLASMSRAIRDFGNAIRRPDAVALFYYSGHGVQYRGANYLVPAKSDIQDPDELAFSAINAEQVYAKMESSGDKTNIVILDACRNNPFPGSERAGERGLAIVGTAPPQSLIVYATAPGKTAQDGEGRNGLFTAALLKHIDEPNLDIELMVRKVRADVIEATGGAQVPWHNSSISGSGFAFSTKKEPEAKAPASVASAAPTAKAKPPAGKGVMTISSDPAGMQVVVDGAADAYETPFSLELEAGAHSFEPKQTVIGYTYYAAQPPQWITVAAGNETSVPLRIKPEMAKLLFKRVPPGYVVYIDGESIGETPLGMSDEVEVKAGVLSVRFEKVGENGRNVSVGVPPGGTNTVSWGGTKETAYPLQRATVKLDGKTDSWEGIEPLYDAEKARPFMGDEKSGILRAYMCRDDKYLYWRVDFNGNDPIMKRPKGAGKAVGLQFDVWNDGVKQDIWFGTQYNADMMAIRYFAGVWDDRTKTSKEDGSAENSGKHTKDMFAGRVEWNWLRNNIPAAEIPRLTLVASDGNWQWINSTKITLEMGWVDFAAAP